MWARGRDRAEAYENAQLAKGGISRNRGPARLRGKAGKVLRADWG